MPGSLSNIGLGSNGALSYDIIEKLREVDEKNQIVPIDRKIVTNTTKKTDLSLLTIMAASLKSSASTLSDEMTYLTRKNSINGTSANITVESGVGIQDFYVDIQSLATKDIYQSKSFNNRDATFASGDDILSLNIGTKNYDIDVTSGTTLSQLKDLINDAGEGNIIASILDVGGDDPYKLIIRSNDTGKDNAISLTSTGVSSSVVADLGLDTNTYRASAPIGNYAGTDTLTFNINGNNHTINVLNGEDITQINSKIQALGLGNELNSKIENGILILESNDSDISISGDSASTFGLDSLIKESGNVQVASNSSFLYNGVFVERSSNTVDDLILGVSIKFNDLGKTTTTITQDTDKISSNVESFVKNYNELMSNLQESIKYDKDSSTSGTFQGNSQILSLKTTLSRKLMEPNKEGINLADFGITLNSSGILELDIEVFNSKLSNTPDKVENFFSSYTDTTTKETVDGYFNKLKSTLSDYVDGKSSILGLFDEQLSIEKTSLDKQKISMVNKLDSRYGIMAKKFMAYDAIISKLNAQFQSLSMMIEASYADKK